MASPVKIKIKDASDVREQIDLLYEMASQKIVSQWALQFTHHLKDYIELNPQQEALVDQGFETCEMWQNHKASVGDVKKIGLAIHQEARNESNEIIRTYLRLAGQAVATGHMKEHGIVASDYAILLINLLHPNQEEPVIQERHYQLETLKKLIESA